MAYTFRDAATPAQISADLRELRAALPAGAIVTYASWLNTELVWESAGGSVSPFLVAFAAIALVLAVLIVAIVAAAAVAASYRRIGVLKSIGFTPAQVAATYLAQLGIPALAGDARDGARQPLGTPDAEGECPALDLAGLPIGLCVRPALGPGARRAGRAAELGRGDHRRTGPAFGGVCRAPADRLHPSPPGSTRHSRAVVPPQPVGVTSPSSWLLLLP
jgi:hypothetical protein